MADEIQQIKTAIAHNQVVVFIGTGVSIYATNGEQEVASSRGLLKNGLQQCYQAGWMSGREFEKLSDKFESHSAEVKDYLRAAVRIKSCFRMEFKVWLAETIGKLSVKKPELIEAIGELECPIITTNYDRLLEQVLKTDIVHVHGRYDQTESIIFTSEDYAHLRENTSDLKKRIENKTLLLIGYGAGLIGSTFVQFTGTVLLDE